MPESSIGGRSGNLVLIGRLPPMASTRDRNVRRCRELRVPNLGENREGSVRRFRELREDGCLQCRPAASADIGITGVAGTR